MSPDESNVSKRVKAAISDYEGEQFKIAQEGHRIAQLRALIEATQVFEIGCLKRDSRNRDHVEPVTRYGRERLIRLSVDGGSTDWEGDYAAAIASRASEIAGVPLHALLMSWVAEQERELDRRRAVWQARDLTSEIAAALTTETPHV